ncbi:MAG: ABC transporter permease [Acidiferrobacterales bacterium]
MNPHASTFSLKRVRAVARKEIWHILRDPFTLALALGLPLLLVMIFGVAINFDVKNARVAVDDRDHSQDSRELAQIFENTGAFQTEHVAPQTSPESLLRAGRDKAMLIIEPDFEKLLASGKPARVQLLLDGADNTTAGSILGYLAGIQDAANRKLVGNATPPAATVATLFLYNPELSTQWFIIPGLTVAVIAIISIMLTALTVAREWENGSMELLLSTPVQPIELILGKLAPYTVIGLLAVFFIYVVARVVFAIPFRGSHLVFLAGCFLFLSAYLAQGLLISVVTRTQQVSMQFALISGLLPSLLLSGFVFPISSMPQIFQYLTAVFPARWFMEISRDLFLKGTSFSDLVSPFFALVVLNFALLTITFSRFKRDLEP